MHLDCACRTMHDFVQRHQDVGLDILAAMGDCLALHTRPLCSAKPTGCTTVTAEELLEEIAEAGAVEMEFGTRFSTSAESPCLLRLLPVGIVPVRSQFIILAPLIGMIGAMLFTLILFWIFRRASRA